MLRKTLAVAASAVLFLLLYDCSNPVDEQLRWSTKTEVPVTNDEFSFIEEINNIYEDDTGTISIIDPDPTKKGDVLRVKNSQNRNIVIDISEDSIETQTVVAVLGPVPVVSSVKFGDTATLNTAAGEFNGTIPLTIPYLYDVTFYDTVNNDISVKIENISSSSLSNVTVGIDGVDTVQVDEITSGAYAIIKLDARGKRLVQTVQVHFAGNAASAGTKSLGLEFSLGGMLIGSCRASDSLVKFSQTVKATYDITDTVALDYVDVKSGTFFYKVENQSRLRFNVSLEHEHVWVTSYCRENDKENVADLNSISAADSATKFVGNVLLTTQGVSIQPLSDGIVARLNLSSYRLFGVWDEVRQEAVTSAVYTLETPKPTGDTIAFSAGDSLKLTLVSEDFKFDEFLGTVMVPYTREADTQKVAINLPNPMNETMKDSLRNHVLLALVNGDIACTTKTNDRAFIDTMIVKFKASALGFPAARDSSTVRFNNVRNDSIFKRTVNITNVANQFPDTVIITSNVTVPKGTRMRACNSHEDDNSSGIGKMTITMGTRYDFLSSIDWGVLLPTYLDLGGSRFSVMEPLRFIKKLENRLVTMNLKIRNSSNMHMRLYSLIAPRKLIDTLDSMSTNDFVKLARSKGNSEALGYVNFFGSDGVFVPPRDSTFENNVVLNHNQLETILNSDTCSWRWLARLEPQPRDSLMDTDYLDIRSKLRIEGINSIDSLVQW